MNWMLVLQFIILQFVVFGVVIFFLRRTFLTSTEGAVQRLERETEEAHTKQAELEKKIKEADEELAKRKKEAEELAKKLLQEADEKAREERDKIIQKARADGEEVISKAQRTRDQMRKDVQKEVELKMITFSAELLDEVLSKHAKGALDQQLCDEFIMNLEKVDMAQIGTDVGTIDVITARAIDPAIKNKIAEVIKKKLGRDVKINATVDAQVIGGVVLRFGSLALDASLQSLITEASIERKEKAENV